MLPFFLKHGQDLFILSVFPIVGLILDLSVSKKIIGVSLFVAGLLFAPAVLGYNYTIPYMYQVLLICILASIYAFYSSWVFPQSWKVIMSLLTTAVLSIFLGYGAFLDAFAGFQETKNTWEVEGYKIEYIKDQGFSGRPLMKYELSEYGYIPLFIKTIETVTEAEDAQQCSVNFENSHVTFNKCTVAILKNTR